MRSTTYWLPRIAAIIKKLRRTLQQVDVVELQAFQAELHRVEDVLPALAILVHVATVVGRFGTPEALPRIAPDGEVELLKERWPWLAFSHMGSENVGDSDLGHDHDLLTGQIQLLDRLAEYDLREPIGVNLAPADRTSESLVPSRTNSS